MDLFERVAHEDYEQVVFCHDRPTGLRAVIAVHSTMLGPSLGGTRYHPYPSEDAAVEDVLRLSKGMTYKSAVAGLDLGGGKAVIIGDPHSKTEALLRAYGRFVHSLGGRYITAEDVGTTQADMDLILRETPFVTGVSQSLGGSGDPSAATARGVLFAMRAVASFLWGSTSLENRQVVVSGVGKVGYSLVRHLVEERAAVTVADVQPAAVERASSHFDVAVVPPEKAHTVECDIFSPCAMGGVLTPLTIPELKCAAVVGSANNQLLDDGCATLLEEAGVLYAPDYVVNSGGIINVAEELRGYDFSRAEGEIRRIYDTTAAVLATAAAEGVTTLTAANRLAERRLEHVGGVNRIRIGTPPVRRR
ncbi:MAG TPA: Glu/Leu/Phe/Val dehydrogenase dimerization domain-containing protein [Acidimicrobiales bacterium]|nr:Glu/Leu/Phe/Val dehydrogenase dimerization domain-containing protein [Acidimicrobiales bacterium]